MTVDDGSFILAVDSLGQGKSKDGVYLNDYI